ncbi:glycosyl hydrolase [Flavobacterium sufflavum]|uniref:Glycosyl hydrolase n=1 Tax=Flavobacterium sufflavum TaxID=1921138 RepID=A0A437L2P6_9FLAO|nr:glycosyl hydrolase 115 family protein [Flavobacterium sufflavum]RVT79569.1 glycosyl hydrolase [Flavobacterium sufflavum]
MKNKIQYSSLLILFFTSHFFWSQENKSSFLIADKNKVSTIYIDQNADQLVVWAVNELANDIQEITAQKPAIVKTQKSKGENGIYIGQINESVFKNYTKPNLKGAWEKFSIDQDKNNLYIVGSDVRGTVYGIFETAERLGISPWKWWADVNNIKKETLVLNLPTGGITESPSVQFRGIFLNDEDWGLQPWAAKTFEKETKDIGPKTYEKIFQLLLRLKANTIWPAMHESTKAFFKIEGNKEMAQKYHILLGTSHAEPMLRNNVDEWKKETMGAFNYFTNSENINKYWQDRLNEVRDSKAEAVFTLGMRGVHDSQMEGAKNVEEAKNMVEKIIIKQREMLASTFKKPITSIPQVMIPYKEVLEQYNKGLKVPEDITLMWTDDNYGYIRRISNEKEQKRIGGGGIYYHLSYWGRPHDYLWLSSMQPGLIWSEMSKAYANGDKKMWIVNVGDIKPAEYDLEFFMDLAWDINSIKPDGINQHLKNWAAREFNDAVANDVSNVMSEYYRLAMLRKPEFMGWSQTEPTTQIKPSEFTTQEAKRRIELYDQLMNEVNRLSQSIPNERKDAWFQLVVYPVKSAAYINHKFLYWQLSLESKDQAEKEKFENLSKEGYHQIEELTRYYNNEMSNGKWANMMSMAPRKLPVFDAIKYDNPVKIEEKKEANPTNESIAIQAKDFSASQGVKNYQWKAIEGFGYSNAAITLFPLKTSSFESEKPSVTYTFESNNTGEYEIEVRFIPTHANDSNHQATVTFDSNTNKTFKLNSYDRDATWKANVLRNAAIVTLPVKIENTGKHTIKIEVNQTGIVIDQLAVYPKGQKKYEIPFK